MQPVFQRLLLCLLLLCGLATGAHAAPSVSGSIECGDNLSPDDRLHCENVLLDAADAELNEVYQMVLPLLDDTASNALRTAQRAWVAYRDMNFETFSAADPAQGRDGLAERVREMRLVTRARAAQLRKLARLAGGGDAEEGAQASAQANEPVSAVEESVVPQPPSMAESVADSPGSEDAPQSAPASVNEERKVLAAEEESPTMDPTAVKSGAGLDSLLGRHPLRIQWLSGQRSGVAEFTERDGVVWLSGRQGKGEDELIIEGRVSTVREDSFTLHGRVTTRINYLGGGAPCVREGVLWFVRKNGRPFWRLQSITNPCTGVSDYVDIGVEMLE